MKSYFRGKNKSTCVCLKVLSCCPPLSRKLGDIKSHLFVCLSVCHKKFNFCTITDKALILGMCVPCDKTFPVVPCRDLDSDLWPTSRSNLLPSGGPQFSEFACLKSFWLCVKSAEQCKMSKLSPNSHCALHMTFIYKITEVKFCITLRKYHDVTIATNDTAAYTQC